jgi:ComEC/Rec2-related protein
LTNGPSKVLSFMEILAGRRFTALRCAAMIGAGIVAGLLLPESWEVLRVLGVLRAWWMWLIAAGLSVLPVIFVSRKFLYLTLFLLAAPYAQLSLPESMPENIYGMNAEIEGKLTGNTGKYSIIKIDTPDEFKGRKVLVYMTRDEKPGTSFRVQGRLLPLAFPRNPGLSNRNKRLQHQGVIGRISTSYVKTTKPAQGIRKWLNQTRQKLIKRNRELFGERAAIYTAILLGQRGEVPEELYADMRRTGTLHLLAVSGLHVGVLVAFLFLLMRLVHIPRKLILPLLAIMLCFYIALVGPRPSIIRASVMSLAVAAGFAFERKVLALNSLAIAALGLILIQPSQILSVGFQLSFAAAFGIIIAAAGIKETLQSKHKLVRKIPKKLTRWILLPLALSAAATLATMPILAANFHRITLAPILANLPVIPLVSLILPLGLVALLLSLVWFPLGQIVGFAVSGLLWLVENLLQLLPGSLYPSGSWAIGLVAAIFLTALILHSEKGGQRRFKYALGVLLIGANLAVWPWALESRKPQLTLLDTYHGNVAVLQSDGHTVLLNPGSKAEPTVTDFLDSRGIRRIDWVLCLSDKEGDLSGLDAIIEHAGRLILPSCTVEYDLAMREWPFYVVKSDDRRVIFTSEAHRIDQEADVNYLLNRYIRPRPTTGRIISKTLLKHGESEVIREQGGVLLRL